jgi:hypothetical protein
VISNLVGIPMSLLAFVLPPLMELRLRGAGQSSRVRIVGYYTLALAGLVICIVTTVFSFLGFADDYDDYGCGDATRPCAAVVPDPTESPAAVPRMLWAVAQMALGF